MRSMAGRLKRLVAWRWHFAVQLGSGVCRAVDRCGRCLLDESRQLTEGALTGFVLHRGTGCVGLHRFDALFSAGLGLVALATAMISPWLPSCGTGYPLRQRNPPNTFTASAEIVLTRERVARPHEKHHAYCNIIAGFDRRFGTRGSGGGSSCGSSAHCSTAGLSLVPR